MSVLYGNLSLVCELFYTTLKQINMTHSYGRKAAQI